MKTLFSILLIFICTYGFAERFTDSQTSLSFEIPSGFEFNAEESAVDEVNGKFWYLFSDTKHNILTIEIEEYDHVKSLSEHFHYNLTDDEDSKEGVVFEGLDFRNSTINGIEFTKCKLRLLAVSDLLIEPIYMCDYLFVKDHFGFTISLMEREDQDHTNKGTEKMMLELLNSIQFQ